MPPVVREQNSYRVYARRRLAGTAYRRGFREGNLFWRIFWYGLLVVRAWYWLKPAPVLVAREVLKPGETVTIRQTTEKVGKRRR
jgi:hypothetical protein